MSNEPELMPIKDFLQKFSISRTQTYKEIAEGRLPLVKRGFRSFIARSDAFAWFEALPRSGKNGEQNAA